MTRARRQVLKGILSGAAVAASGVLAIPALAADRRSYTLATATRGGTYYPVGVALSTLVKAKLLADHGIDLSARISAGSIANIGMLRANKAQFAIVLGIVGTLAAKGQGPFAGVGPAAGLRSVSALWPDVEHFLVRRDRRKTGDLRDFLALKGQPVSIGAEGSGVLASTRQVLRGQGLDPDTDFRNTGLQYADGATALLRGRIEGAAMPGGLPVTAVTQLLAPEDQQVALLGITDAQLQAADAGLGLWSRHEIPVGTYPGQSRPIPSMAQRNVLIARADVDADPVYRIVKTMYEHIDFLQGIHPATKAMSVDRALRGVPLPPHPGAVKFYREAGLEVPQRLLP